MSKELKPSPVDRASSLIRGAADRFSDPAFDLGTDVQIQEGLKGFQDKGPSTMEVLHLVVSAAVVAVPEQKDKVVENGSRLLARLLQGEEVDKKELEELEAMGRSQHTFPTGAVLSEPNR